MILKISAHDHTLCTGKDDNNRFSRYEIKAADWLWIGNQRIEQSIVDQHMAEESENTDCNAGDKLRMYQIRKSLQFDRRIAKC